MKTFFLYVFVFFFIFPEHALAYVDPGSGSYMLQILLAFLFGALASIKIFWRKIRAFFGSLTARGRKSGKNGE